MGPRRRHGGGESLMPHLRHFAVIECPVSEVYALASQVERYPEFLPGYLESRILERESDRVLLQRSAMVAGAVKKWKSWASFKENETILFEHAEGPLKGMRARWTFTALSPHQTALEITHDFEMAGPRGFRRIIETMQYKREIDRLASLIVVAFKKAAENQSLHLTFMGADHA
jgi:coenzyme Q-binding protein COQ10